MTKYQNTLLTKCYQRRHIKTRSVLFDNILIITGIEGNWDKNPVILHFIHSPLETTVEKMSEKYEFYEIIGFSKKYPCLV